MMKITRRSFGLLATSSVVGVFGGAAAARADDVAALDVVVSSEPALQPMMEDLGRLWRSQGGARVHVFAARSDLLLEEIWRGARSDLVVIEGRSLADAAVGRALIKPETRRDAWRNRLVIAAYDNAQLTIRLAPESDLVRLLGAGRLALADAALSPAGTATRAALETLGLWRALDGRTIGVESTETVALLLTTGKAALGALHASDVAATPSLSTAATFPDDTYPEIVYSLAITQSTPSDAAQRFLEFLRGRDAQTRVKAGGLELLA